MYRSFKMENDKLASKKILLIWLLDLLVVAVVLLLFGESILDFFREQFDERGYTLTTILMATVIPLGALAIINYFSYIFIVGRQPGTKEKKSSRINKKD